MKDYNSNYDGLSYVFSPSVKEYVIGEDVTRIGNYAFSECHYLTSIIIPKSVTDIGIDAFQYCDALQSIQVENGNPVYDSRGNCNAIIETATNTLQEGTVSTVIPSSVRIIGESAFSSLKLGELNVPEGVERVEEYAFYNCGISALSLPHSLRYIGRSAFYSNPLLYHQLFALFQQPMHQQDKHNIVVLNDSYSHILQ